MAVAGHNLLRYPPSPAPSRSLSTTTGRSSCVSYFSPPTSSSSRRRLCPIVAKSQGGEGRSGRRIWRRRRLTKYDDKLRYKMERISFLEEQVRKIRENGEIISLDIHRLMLSEENRFDFVNDIAEEANSYIENNRDEYGAKKPILHVLSNRLNEAGFERSEAYMEDDPFRPGPSYLRQDLG